MVDLKRSILDLLKMRYHKKPKTQKNMMRIQYIIMNEPAGGGVPDGCITCSIHHLIKRGLFQLMVTVSSSFHAGLIFAVARSVCSVDVSKEMMS